MQATFLKRVLPFCLTLLLGIGVTVAIGRVFHSGKRVFSYRISKFYGCDESRPRSYKKFVPAISIRYVPDGQIPPFFDSEMEGYAFIKMEALFDPSGRVTEVRFPDYKPYVDEASPEDQRRTRRLEQELMDSAAEQVRQIDFRPLRTPQWLNVETAIFKRNPVKGCNSVKVKIIDQNGDMRWEGETLAAGRRCGANLPSF